MRSGRKTLVCVLGTLIVCSSANGIVADTDSNPYQAIVERNVFGLRAPPPPPDPEANKPPPPKITPTGITTILGNKRALFKVQEPARPPQPAKEQSYILTEGQREGQIEVLEIDEKTGAIKFNNHGVVMTLTLEKDGAKVPNTPPAPTPPVAPPPGPTYTMQPPPAATLPAANPAMPEAAVPGMGMKTIPTRTLRLPGATSGQAPAAPGMPPVPPQ